MRPDRCGIPGTHSRRAFLQQLSLGLGSAACMPLAGDWVAPGRDLIDGLCIPVALDEDPAFGPEHRLAARSSGLTAVNMTTPRPGDGTLETTFKINILKNIIKVNSDILRLVLLGTDLDRCRKDGRLGIIIGFQSTEMLAGGAAAVEAFHHAGARIMQLSYNGPGVLGHGCLSEVEAGLTSLGREALTRMHELGVLVDAAHANRATTAEAIASSPRPITISHTGCNAVYRHPRNNDDAELRALADRGGVAGIYLMPFLDGGSGELTVDMLFAHLEHALQVCGVEGVGIGSDQGLRPVADGPEYRRRLREEVLQRRAAGISAPGESPDRPPFIPALNRSDRLLAIADEMEARGHSARVIEAVTGGNFGRLMRASWRG